MHLRELTRTVLISAALWAAAWPASALSEAVDPHAEVAAALFASSATMAAVEKAADAQLRTEQTRIVQLAAQVRSGEARRRSELAAAQEGFVAQLAQKDRAYAQAIAVFRGAVNDIAATPDGAAALARFNAGDEAGALDVLDKLRAADDASRRAREAIESAAEGRRIAQLALEARTRGKVSTASVIKRYEDVTRLDPVVFDDWIDLARLDEDAGRTADAQGAAQSAAKAAAGDFDRAEAQSELGDILLSEGDVGGASTAYDATLVAFKRLVAAAPDDDNLARNLSVALEKSGEIASRQGDVARAGKSLEASLAIRRRLAEAHPQHVDTARDLSV